MTARKAITVSCIWWLTRSPRTASASRSCCSTVRPHRARLPRTTVWAASLELAGIHAHMISMDDYYRTSGTYDIPFDEGKRRQ